MAAARARSAAEADAAAARHRELMEAIADLAARLDPQGAAVAGRTPDGADRDAGGAADLGRLRNEVEAILGALAGVKREIADLGRDHRLLDAVRQRASAGADPFDVLANATDSANAAILAAAERIDDLIAAQKSAAAAEDATWLDEVGDNLVRIFEACNVHDFASLRVGRFLMTMKQVEARLRGLAGPVGWLPGSDDADPPTAVRRLTR